MVIEKTIDHTLYPRQAITEARQAYKDYCTFKVSPSGNNRALLHVSVNPKYSSDAREVALEFLNYALDRAVQLKLDQG